MKLGALVVAVTAALAASTAARAALVRCSLATPAVAPAFAPDGKELAALTAAGDRWTLVTFGTTTPWTTQRDVITYAFPSDPYDASWSPDRRYIAVADGYALHVVDTETGAVTEIWHGAISSPVIGGWSPDGGELLYSYSVYDSNLQRPNGRSFLYDVTSGASHFFAEGFSPAWAPDGSAIAYVVAATGSENDLVLARPDGSGARAIVRKVALNEPHWSPDSQRLLYGWYIDVFPHVFVVARDGASDHEVGEIAGGGWVWRTPGVLHTQWDSDSDSWVARFNPTTRKDAQITRLPRPFDASFAAASPDGRVVVYTLAAGPEGPTYGLRVVDHGVDRPLVECGGTRAPDTIVGTKLNDRISSVGGGRDVVRCGAGRDVVVADRRDRVARDCERVLR